MPCERKYYCVYIMGSLSGTLYVGISGNLHKRVFQHKFHHFAGFTDRYEVTRLLLLGVLRRSAQSAGARKSTEKMDSREEGRVDRSPESSVARPGVGVGPVDEVCSG